MATPRLPPALAAALTAAVAVAAPCAATPSPTPVPAPPPAPAGLIPSLPAIGNALAQDGSDPAGPFGLPDLSAHAPSLLLGQNPQPAPPAATPGPQGPTVMPSLSAFDPAYLLPLNLTPAAPGEGTPAPGLGPGPDSPGTGRLSFLGRLYEMYQGGYLKGALLGQTPAEEFGESATD